VRFRPELTELHLGEVQVVSEGAVVPYGLKAAEKAVSGTEVSIALDLHTGPAEATIWTCDFTAEYVRINADYHT